MTTAEKIQAVVRTYAAVPPDFRDIDRLTSWNRKLACVLFEYAREVGGLYEISKGSEYARKAAFERERLRLIGEGKSAAASEIEARNAVESLAFSETEADVQYRAALLQYHAARDVMEAMRPLGGNAGVDRRYFGGT